MLLLKLRVLDPSGLERPSLGAAVIRNSPMALASFGPISGNSAIDAGLGIAAPTLSPPPPSAPSA